MNKTQIKKKYYDWLCNLVSDNIHPRDMYTKLFKALYTREFTYIHPMDKNRQVNGIGLRYYDFGYERGISYSVIPDIFDDNFCSVLEMMVSVAKRMESSLYHDEYVGRTPIWFWHLNKNLGLEDMTDSNFSQVYFDDVMERFLNRRYKKDGTGGLFVTQDKTKDMREIEIWLQMDEFISTKFREEQGD
jgi:hypothetical protein